MFYKNEIEKNLENPILKFNTNLEKDIKQEIESKDNIAKSATLSEVDNQNRELLIRRFSEICTP